MLMLGIRGGLTRSPRPLTRSFLRGKMSPKRGNKNFYKGYGARRMGKHTSKGLLLRLFVFHLSFLWLYFFHFIFQFLHFSHKLFLFLFLGRYIIDKRKIPILMVPNLKDCDVREIFQNKKLSIYFLILIDFICSIVLFDLTVEALCCS
jgi:hypothetical protein